MENRAVTGKDFVDVTLLGNYPYDENESMIRYAEMLRKLLVDHGFQVELIRPEPIFGRLKRGIHGLAKWLGYIDKYILFPISLRKHIRRRKMSGGEFLVHVCDHSNAPYTQWLQDVPHLVTCHDLMAIQCAVGLIPGQRTGWTGRILQNWILSGLRNARYIVCITPETREDLLSLAPELEGRSRAIELPLNYPFSPMPKTEAIALLDMEFNAPFHPAKDRFLFHVGGNQWYKNREGVISIYAQLCASHPELLEHNPLKLVMAGKPPTKAMLQLAQKEGVASSVIFVTSVSNEQICAFYNLTEIMIYPSLKEGFGWPIIEAQACGCPIITSDRPPMNRIAGPSVMVADPENKSDFVDKIFKLLTESIEVRSLRKEESIRHARRFDSGYFLNQMRDLYEGLTKK